MTEATTHTIDVPGAVLAVMPALAVMRIRSRW